MLNHVFFLFVLNVSEQHVLLIQFFIMPSIIKQYLILLINNLFLFILKLFVFGNLLVQMGHVGSVVLVWVTTHSLVASFNRGAGRRNRRLPSGNSLLQMQVIILVLLSSTSKSDERFILSFLRFWCL